MASNSSEFAANGASDRIELFVRLLGAHQHQIHRYVLCLVPSAHDADDILQETNLYLWREFHKFEEGTNFVAWACAVAYHKVIAWRKQKSREKLVFNEAFLMEVSDELITGVDRQEKRAAALNKCIERLPAVHRELLQLRYGSNQKIDAIATQQGRSIDAVYRMLSRVRQTLFNCVNSSLSVDSIH